MNSRLVRKNITIDGRRTSIRLELEMWSALDDICLQERLSMHDVCTLIDHWRGKSSRTSAVRAFIVAYFRNLAGESRMAEPRNGKFTPEGKFQPMVPMRMRQIAQNVFGQTVS